LTSHQLRAVWPSTSRSITLPRARIQSLKVIPRSSSKVAIIAARSQAMNIKRLGLVACHHAVPVGKLGGEALLLSAQGALTDREVSSMRGLSPAKAGE
jgi:hypothetical protein